MDSNSIQSSALLLSMSTILSLLFSAFIVLSICSHAADQDTILLNCGSSSTVPSQDRRIFVGDHTSKFTPSTSTEAAASEPIQSTEILYRTARLFTAKSTYTVPITATSQRHFLRFHFYPSSYSTHKLIDADFSVNWGSYVLLHNFTLATLKQPHVIEFCIPVTKRKQLEIIFTPEATNPKSYAFINAMEIISIPDRLFGSPAIIPGSNFQSNQYKITLNTALQKLYRLNVGGHTISPDDDKYGRTWDDDSKFIFGAAMGRTGTNSTEIEQADDFAPNDVYATYRSMDPNSLVNLNFNLSWVFSNIDANFSYLVRLHFCELQLTKGNQRKFDIYINNQTAEEAFDVIEVASGPNIPIYRDYLIYVPADESTTTDLWVELHPNNKTRPPSERYNAILNGLEIFKLNDSSGNLAGLNPVVTEETEESTANGPVSSPSSSKHKGYIIGIVSGSLGGLVSLLCLMILSFALKRRSKNSKGSHEKPFTAVAEHAGGTTTTTTTTSTESSAFTGISNNGLNSVVSIFYRYFSFSEIQDATNNFDDSLLLGVGGFGKVYRGEISGGTGVAIKRAKTQSLQGSHEFRNEIDLLSRLRHKNLVSLIGYCDQNSEMCLVYDYVPNGTLEKHLHGKNPGSTVLSWKQRLEICIGAAKGLDYLHSGAFQTVIHRDVKSTNILLDENLSAKVSDFGLSKTVGTSDQSHVTTDVKGSFGYMDPEYFYSLTLTKKSDVYSFGVVLFEVLCAKPAVMSTQSGEKINLSDCVLEHLRDDALEHMIDPNLVGDITSDSFQIFAEVGEKCLAGGGEERPSMADVVWHLEFSLQIHETATCQRKTTCGVISDEV
ncbi:receptor-like protein kinase FERONIA [Cryptomeria japonica]|uniref:receptor-like protein kinase FERONIA n=1 Tax=Cryptomeria japonica TaxID=3369 RepID=UPI0025AC7A85|nr:receptor-like protein kinase FERONIA [Cryptomeria japonica]